MIIEDRMINTDVEEGNFITVTGRSLESIDRRIIGSKLYLLEIFKMEFKAIK